MGTRKLFCWTQAHHSEGLGWLVPVRQMLSATRFLTIP